MIGALLAPFDLAQAYAGIVRGFDKHFAEHIVFHEVGARAGCEVAAAWQQAHGCEVDFFVAAPGIAGRVVTLVKAGGSSMMKSSVFSPFV